MHEECMGSHFIAGIVLAVVFVTAHPAAAASCESLATLSLPHTTITLANVVDAGTFVQFPPARGGAPAPPPAQARGAGAGAGEGAGRGAGAGGAGQGRGRGAPISPFADLPAFCRVLAMLMPS